MPATPAAEQEMEDQARQYAADCEQKFGWLLPYLTTVDSARDMDSIRAALGQRQISYDGVSYGSYLGQVYATLFAHRVRRMVLDSVVDPAGAWYADNIDQDYAFQGRMQGILRVGRGGRRDLPARHDSGRRERDVRGHDGPAGRQSDRRTVGPADRAGRAELYNAVECSDVAWPRNWARWDADTRRAALSAPYESWANAWFNAACAFWPVRGPAAPPRVDGAGLVNGTCAALPPPRA